MICLEDLNMKFQQKQHGKGVLDLGFSDFVKILKYVASRTGSTVVEVDRFYPSSQLCHVCGYKNPITKDQRIREYDCPVCGTHHDRDVNAAINIQREGTRIFLAS